MRGTTLLLKVDDTIDRREWVNRVPDLEFFRGGETGVGGYLEAVPYFRKWKEADESWVDCMAYCNEEGKLNGLPLNRLATTAWKESQLKLGVSVDDILVGDVVVFFGDREFMDEM